MNEIRSEIPLNEIAVKRNDSYPGRPTIVFLHDSWGCIDLWRDFPDLLGHQTKCNILVYDRQGYGKSLPFAVTKRANDYLEQEADLLNLLLDYWELDKVFLYGHSDGGSIALIAAAKYPKKIVGLITEGAHVFVEDITLQGIRNAIPYFENGSLKSKLEKYHGEKTDAVFWLWADTWLNAEFKAWNIEHFLPSIKCRTLCIQGEDDEYGSMAQVDSITSKIKGDGTAFLVPGAKHSPYKEATELVLNQVAAFVQETVSSKKLNF